MAPMPPKQKSATGRRADAKAKASSKGGRATAATKVEKAADTPTKPDQVLAESGAVEDSFGIASPDALILVWQRLRANTSWGQFFPDFGGFIVRS